jgi:hypothetical protein
MKTRSRPPVPAILLTTAALLCGWSLAHAAPPGKEKSAPATAVRTETASSEVEIPRSVFVIPATPEEGRDPFFPNSNRLSAGTRTTKLAAPVPAEVSLVLNGLSGTPEHRLAIINYQTFAEGDEAEVTTRSGRVRVRCVEIKGETVVVEVAGARRELRFENR